MQDLIASLFPVLLDLGVEATGNEECAKEKWVVWRLCFTSH